MNPAEQLALCLTGDAQNAVRSYAARITNLRIRCSRCTTLEMMDGGCIDLAPMDRSEFDHLLLRLMDNSVYARAGEIQNGYFTAAGGFRVGVCGRIDADSVDLSGITSICIRFARQKIGCAAFLHEIIAREPYASMLIVSPPGMGKTTMLRDLARSLSGIGAQIAIADERREICGCICGVPGLDVGVRMDIMDGCAKHIAIPMLVRCMAPDIVIADEIGNAADADCLLDARRCGVAIIASAHGRDIEETAHRKCIASLFENGTFDYAALLGDRVGKIVKVHDLKKGVDIVC